MGLFSLSPKEKIERDKKLIEQYKRYIADIKTEMARRREDYKRKTNKSANDAACLKNYLEGRKRNIEHHKWQIAQLKEKIARERAKK